MNQEKKKIILLFITTTLVLLGVVLFTAISSRSGDFHLGNKAGVIVSVIVGLLLSILTIRRFKDVKQGQPFEDEFSKKVVNMAAARSFYISLYWMLAIILFQPIFADIFFAAEKLDAEQALGGAIMGMSVIFLFSWIYYQKKGTL